MILSILMLSSPNPIEVFHPQQSVSSIQTLPSIEHQGKMRFYSSLLLILLLLFASAIPLTAGALSNSELVNCFTRIFDYLGLKETLTEEGASVINSGYSELAEAYCNMMAERMVDGSLLPTQNPSTSSYPSDSPFNSSITNESTGPLHRNLQVALFPPDYPTNGDVQILINEVGLTGTTRDRIEDGLDNR
jgi:hypothetical protein